MFNKLLDKITEEFKNEKNIEVIEEKVISPIMAHLYERLKKYIFRVLMMYYLIIILLLIIIIFLMKRK